MISPPVFPFSHDDNQKKNVYIKKQEEEGVTRSIEDNSQAMNVRVSPWHVESGREAQNEE